MEKNDDDECYLPNEETIEEFKNMMHDKLTKSGMSTVIRQMVREICSTQTDSSLISPDEVIEQIYKRGMIGNIVDEMHTRDTNEVSQGLNKSEEKPFVSDATENIPMRGIENRYDITVKKFAEIFAKLEALTDTNSADTVSDASGSDSVNWETATINGRYYLKMEILGGKAFLEHLFDEDSLIYGHQKPNFVLHVFYKSQRFSTKSTDCCCDPDFKDTFMIDVGYFERGNISQLLNIREPLRLVLVRNDVNSLCSTVISHCLHDWRFFLTCDKNSQRFSLELMGIGSEYKIPIGILNIRLTLLPHLPQQVSKTAYLGQINLEKAEQEDSDRLFLIYAKQWWKDFHEIRPEHAFRNIKLFSYDENMVSRPVQTFVTPIAADKTLLTPHHASWFVSLMPVTVNEADFVHFSKLHENFHTRNNANTIVPVSDSGYWQSLQSTLVAKSGSIQDHATLLCSLLIGFGLEAYVALGTKVGNISWTWVISLDMNSVPTFWETTTGLTGNILSQDNPLVVSRNGKRVDLGFKTIGCLFNNRSFYANIQPSDRIDAVDWNVSNPCKWKKISEISFKRNQVYDSSPVLLNGTRNIDLLASEMEIQFKSLIAQARMNVNLSTQLDDRLRVIMGQKLAQYEIEASASTTFENNHFESAILNSLSSGYDFKGFPMHSNSVDSLKIFNKFIGDPQCKEIVFYRGEDVHLSVRVSCFLYPEDAISVRIMFACRFISVR